ncbi:MAG: sensor histidine kinase, partial [Persicimonas sp.]
LHSARELLLDPEAMLLGYEREVDLCAVLSKLAEVHRPQLQRNGRKLIIEDNLDEPRISGEPKLLSEMFEGLLGASLSATPPDTNIAVSLEPLDRQTVEIVYRDQGRPMSDRVRHKLFGGADEIFGELDPRAEFEPDAARDTVEALSLCSMIVEAHGGVMRAEGDDTGRCFRIHLPR